MNALITRSEEARAQLLASSALDDLSYHLMILEAGCRCLDETLRPVGTTVSEAMRDLYRDHMVKEGWWTWFELFWRGFEVRLAAEWFGPESLVPRQSAEWQRQRLHEEALTLYYTDHYHRAFDMWLKMLEERGAHSIAIPIELQPLPKHQHDHVH